MFKCLYIWYQNVWVFYGIFRALYRLSQNFWHNSMRAYIWDRVQTIFITEFPGKRRITVSRIQDRFRHGIKQVIKAAVQWNARVCCSVCLTGFDAHLIQTQISCFKLIKLRISGCTMSEIILPFKCSPYRKMFHIKVSDVDAMYAHRSAQPCRAYFIFIPLSVFSLLSFKIVTRFLRSPACLCFSLSLSPSPITFEPIGRFPWNLIAKWFHWCWHRSHTFNPLPSTIPNGRRLNFWGGCNESKRIVLSRTSC